MIAALIVAAGRGARTGNGRPKQFRNVGGRTVLARGLEVFCSHPDIDAVVVVIRNEDSDLYRAILGDLSSAERAKILPNASGGPSRQESVLNGLRALRPLSPRLVLVHDAARPFVSGELLDRAIEVAGRVGAGIPGIPVSDTIKVVDEAGQVCATPAREGLRAIQTPQAFDFATLAEVHERAAAAGLVSFSDDASLLEWAGLPVEVFEGDPGNVKLTHPADFDEAERRIRDRANSLISRTATGFDVHSFTEGDHVWLAGLRIPHSKAVAAHSDGDVILHALTDALLGALADGDIGVHFPPDDAQWRGASSDRFLSDAVERVRARGGVIDHLDATVLCETPRLGPYREAMRQRIADIARLRLDQVSLKATTTEKLGFLGRGEGIAAQAAATVRLPDVSS